MRSHTNSTRVFAAGLVLAGAFTSVQVSVRGQGPVTAQPPVAQAPAAAPAARPANAPPLVPLRVDRDGHFRIAPPYVDDPAFTEKPDVPKGRVIRFTMNSAESKIFPTAPAGRAGGRGGRGGDGRGQGPAPVPPTAATVIPSATPIPPSAAPASPGAPAGAQPSGQAPVAAAVAPPQTFERQIAVYIPAGYVPNTPSPFIVAHDERWYVKEDAPEGRTDLAFLNVMLDNLIHEKRVPPMIAVMLAPGPGGQRTIEYDTVSDRHLNFVETEVLPRIARDYQVAFTTDPEGRAVFGESSSAAAALTMAWLHPNLYRRVISYSGTFVALQRNATAPNGAWDFHQTLIPQSPRKPLRIWLHVGENDNGATSPVENMRNWVIANNRMADVLKAKGYPYQYVFAEASGHVDRKVQRQTLPAAFEWVWKGYKAK